MELYITGLSWFCGDSVELHALSVSWGIVKRKQEMMRRTMTRDKLLIFTCSMGDIVGRYTVHTCGRFTEAVTVFFPHLWNPSLLWLICFLHTLFGNLKLLLRWRIAPFNKAADFLTAFCWEKGQSVSAGSNGYLLETAVGYTSSLTEILKGENIIDSASENEPKEMMESEMRVIGSRGKKY